MIWTLKTNFFLTFYTFVPQLCPNRAHTMPILNLAILCPYYAFCPQLCPNCAPTVPQLELETCPYCAPTVPLVCLERLPTYPWQKPCHKESKKKMSIIGIAYDINKLIRLLSIKLLILMRLLHAKNTCLSLTSKYLL